MVHSPVYVHRLPLVGVYPILYIVFVAVRVLMDSLPLSWYSGHIPIQWSPDIGTNSSLRALKKTCQYLAARMHIQPRMNCLVAHWGVGGRWHSTYAGMNCWRRFSANSIVCQESLQNENDSSGSVGLLALLVTVQNIHSNFIVHVLLPFNTQATLLDHFFSVSICYCQWESTSSSFTCGL